MYKYTFPIPHSEPSPLALLRSQPSHYISALLLGRRYLLTPNDVVTVPKLKGVKVGDTIALTRIYEVGSRDYTLRAPPPNPTSQINANSSENSSSFPQSSSVSSANLTSHKTPLAIHPTMVRNVINEQGVPRDWQRFPNSLGNGLGPDVVKCELKIIEHTKGTMFLVEKFKRRKGYRR